MLEEMELPETAVEEMELSSCAVVVLRKPRERARRGESLRRIRGDTIVASTWCKVLKVVIIAREVYGC